MNKKIKYIRSHAKNSNSRRISEVTADFIKFSDGSQITYDHYQDCCENNYADFDQLDDLARDYTFEGEMKFEAVDNAGFKFGDSRRMFFVPCYSDQNGWYSSNIQIYWNSVPVLGFRCELHDWY